MPLTLSELTDLVMQQAREKGWGARPEDINLLEKLALVHSEISEAVEACRSKSSPNIHGKDGLSEELGDAVMRILHLAGLYNIDLEQEILRKIMANKNRSWADKQ